MPDDVTPAENPQEGSTPPPEGSTPPPEASTPQIDVSTPPSEASTPLPTLLEHPVEGVPPVVTDERRLMGAAAAIADGEGPVAIDAERASGYRYGQNAYLVQLRREGAGTWLIDPTACPDLTPVGDAIGGAEWILHAATQDLTCLAEVGLRPKQLFDTELAARLLGMPRVGLSAVVEHYLGLSLAKEHSAVDWSTRPLPEPWLRYAALDVEVLVEVRNLMGVDLAAQGKGEWARQEFAGLLEWEPTARVDPWRRTSGLHRVRHRRGVAMVRELWEERDRIARERDISPGRVLPDAVVVEIAMAAPASEVDLPAGHRAVRRYQRQWLAAVKRATALPEVALPPKTLPSDAPPPPRSWAEKDPLAAARLTAVRGQLLEFAETHTVPVENVCSPEPLRRVLWTPPAKPTLESFDAALLALGCRQWQRDIVGRMLVAAFAAHPG